METSAKATTPSLVETANTVRDTRPDSVVEITIPGYGTVVQKPLTFFGKNELFGLVAKAIDRAMAEGFSISKMLGSLEIDDDRADKIVDGSLTFSEMADFEDLAGLFMKLFSAVPELLLDAYVIFLNIPPVDRTRVRAALQDIDDETGFLILNTFMDQNRQAVRDFLPRWWKQVQKMMPGTKAEADSSTSSTDSKSTLLTTPNQ